MDPNTNHAEQVRLALEITKLYDLGDESQTQRIADRASELAELVIALNDWIGNGGFPPDKFRGK